MNTNEKSLSSKWHQFVVSLLRIVYSIIYFSFAALHKSAWGVWDGERFYSSVADRDGPSVNKHRAFLWMWRPGQTQTAEGECLSHHFMCSTCLVVHSHVVLCSVFQAFQQEISLNTTKIDNIFQQGEALLEKSEPIDAAVIEEEIEELQRYCQEVFGRVERYFKKLIRLPVLVNTLTLLFI